MRIVRHTARMLVSSPARLWTVGRPHLEVGSVVGREPVEVIDRRVEDRGGAARTAEICRTSHDYRLLAAAVREGRLVRVSRGVVACPDRTDLGVALAHRGALTCVSALRAYGLPLLEPPRACHVTTPTNRGRGVPEAVLHWTAAPVGRHLAPLPLALYHALRCLPLAEWVACADAAVRTGMELVDLQAHRPSRGRLRFDTAVDLVDPRSASLPESLLRVALVGAGLRPEVQRYLPGVGYVDLMIGDLVVEVDGFAYHSGRQQYRDDRRRDRAALALGLRTVRFTFEDVVRRPATVAAEVRDLAGRRG